jgi:hypothetical protein
LFDGQGGRHYLVSRFHRTRTSDDDRVIIPYVDAAHLHHFPHARLGPVFGSTSFYTPHIMHRFSFLVDNLSLNDYSP